MFVAMVAHAHFFPQWRFMARLRLYLFPGGTQSRRGNIRKAFPFGKRYTKKSR
jgi:hypothetical protein